MPSGPAASLQWSENVVCPTLCPNMVVR
jgi:hypothetical protein